ncbi:MAG: hypothetical protein JO072_05055 [Parafilimonas sp.]|nr:hypothetical protein [Parafilimonas sp.]
MAAKDFVLFFHVVVSEAATASQAISDKDMLTFFFLRNGPLQKAILRYIAENINLQCRFNEVVKNIVSI